MKEESILKKDAVLYVDITCWKCKRRVALSNTIEYEGRRYCFSCDEKLRPFKNIKLKKESQ